MKKITLLISLVICILQIVFAQSKQVYQFEIRDNIDPASWRITQRALQKATEANADYILLVLNTYGGQVDMADSIRTALLATPIPTIVFIDHNAASAGALIAIACDRIYMQKGASIGAASVVNQTGDIMPEKYQSYMRSIMRSTAEVNGRNPLIAEGFVDPDLVIDSIKPQGKVISFTTAEAIKYGFCDGQAANIEEVLKAEVSGSYTILHNPITLLDKIIGFLINPAVSGILILLIIGGIYYELQSPGIGFPLIIAILAGILYFAPLYLEGLAANWEILLFISGLILLAFEIFVIPGFGIAGIAGIILLICGLAFSLVANDYFNFTSSGTGAVMNAFALVLFSLIAAIVVSVMFGKNILKSKLFKDLVLDDEQRSDEGYKVSSSEINLNGKSGIALTDLRPSGKIEIENLRYDALSEDGFISKGDEITVTRQEAASVFVIRKK